jgi:membrane protease subunit (stomatin/prohibitin family)
MPLIERIAWDDAQPDDVARRFPDLTLKFGSQVIVMENQWAVFFRDGKAYDVFGPGRHTITSANIPILTAAIRAIGIIGDIFDCEVIFVSNSQFRGNFGGQAYSAPSGQIAYQAELGFYGYLLYQVEDPKLFVIEFFGNRGVSTSRDVENYIRGFVNERVIDALGHDDIFAIVKNLDETTDKISLLISDEAARIGIKIIDTVFEGVKIPEEARRFASGMGSQAMMMQYMKETASELPPGGGAAGAGLGAGIGLAMGARLADSMQPTATGAPQAPQAPQQTIICQKCGFQNTAPNKFCGNCGSNLAPTPTIPCPKCGAQMANTMKFCGNCGSTLQPVSLNCSKCGETNPSGTKFCGNCGTQLS